MPENRRSISISISQAKVLARTKYLQGAGAYVHAASGALAQIDLTFSVTLDDNDASVEVV